MAVGDRLTNPEGDGYSSYEVTDENVVNGRKQAAKLVKIVGDDGSSSAPATAAKQDTGNASLATIATNTGASKLGTPGSGTTTGTAAAIGGALACKSVLLTNTHATNSLLFGNVTAQTTPLLAGASVSLPATNVNEIYVKNGTGAATFAYQPVIAG